MSLFDKVLENFSAKDLKSRVVGVIIMGFIVCAIAGGALYFLLHSVQRISISGIGSWSPDTPGAIVVSVEAHQLALIEARDSVTTILDDPAQGSVTVESKVVSINPAAPSVLIEPQSVPEGFGALTKFDVEMILVEEPMWKMLWGKG
jgi:hypothetical protein